jgi:uncharacterized protein YaaQ
LSEAETIDLLAVAIVMGGQAGVLTQALRESGFRFTEVDSQGGFIQEPVTSLLIGLNRHQLDRLLEIVRENCPSHLQYIPARLDASALQGQPLMIEALMGGATIFAVEVERFVQL